MREPLNQAFFTTFSTYQNLKDCKSKHFFEIDNKFIKSYHFIYQTQRAYWNGLFSIFGNKITGTNISFKIKDDIIFLTGREALILHPI